MASSRRGTAVCRKEGWNTWAKQNVIPASSALRATRSMGRSSRTPSASRTSADPDDDDDARLPCLTTFAPAPAQTSAAMVEMLTVFSWSPPVPTMSSFSPAMSTGFACASMASTSPAISSTVSPFDRSATRNPAICEGVASPDMMASIAHSVLSAVRSAPLIRAEMSRGQVLPAACADACEVTS
ncbi:hypothetical protein D9M72_367690 [compost metagenome]